MEACHAASVLSLHTQGSSHSEEIVAVPVVQAAEMNCLSVGCFTLLGVTVVENRGI